jgi:hypothetical protein
MPHGFHTHNIPTGVKAEEDMRNSFEWILAQHQKKEEKPNRKL